MNRLDIELELAPTPASLDELTAGLNKHAAEFVAKPGYQPIALFARDGSGNTRGGIYGRINWTWLDISLLWVHPDHRGSGLGSALLQRLEAEAIDRGCNKSHVDTASYQAEDFYVAHGYDRFAELGDYPDEHRRIYLKKSLSD